MAKKLYIFVIVYLDDIFIHTKNLGQANVNAVWWLIEELRKYGFFANLKKWQFHKDKVCFLGYVMSAQEVQIEDDR